jgi:hypothetical protein
MTEQSRRIQAALNRSKKLAARFSALADRVRSLLDSQPAFDTIDGFEEEKLKVIEATLRAAAKQREGMR